jgi:Tol biopolymer transport system component
LLRAKLTLAALAVALAALVPASTASAAYPGANGKIAFMGDGVGGYEIYTVNPDGSDLANITNYSQPDYDPRWSPDGTKIAFARQLDGGPIEGIHINLFVMNADGSDVTRVTDTPDAWEGFPSWSPDGKKLAFQRYPGGHSSIFTVDLETGGEVAISHNTDAIRPSWSPDGTKIAYQVTVCCTNYEIFTSNPDGTGATNITNHPSFQFDPEWAPDSSKLAVTRFGGSDRNVFIMNPDGSGEYSLPTPVGFGIAWSPDGSKFVYDGDALRIMNADGSDPTTIETGVDGALIPDWQPLDRPLDCSDVSAVPDSLSPPDHRFRIVTFEGGDPDGDPLSFSIDGVTQDEPLRGQGDHTSPDATLSGDGSVLRLRAESRRRGDGRVYRIAFTASDGRGDTCSGTASVEVPVRRGLPAIDSAPPSYDSLAR